MANEQKHAVPNSHHLSLASIMGKKIVDLHGYVHRGFGVPVFKVSKVVFEDGSAEWLDGEHDIAFIPSPGDDGPLGEANLNEIQPPDYDEEDGD